MLLRSVVFVAVCAPVWALYAVHDARGHRPLPGASAVAWTGTHAAICFAGPVTAGRPTGRRGRRVRVVRRRGQNGRVPTVRLVDPAEAAPAGRATPLDPRVWARVRRAIGDDAYTDPAPPAVRPAARRGRVRFFDHRVTLCGVGGVVIENPDIVRPVAPMSSHD